MQHKVLGREGGVLNIHRNSPTTGPLPITALLWEFHVTYLHEYIQQAIRM